MLQLQQALFLARIELLIVDEWTFDALPLRQLRQERLSIAIGQQAVFEFFLLLEVEQIDEFVGESDSV